MPAFWWTTEFLPGRFFLMDGFSADINVITQIPTVTTDIRI